MKTPIAPIMTLGELEPVLVAHIEALRQSKVPVSPTIIATIKTTAILMWVVRYAPVPPPDCRTDAVKNYLSLLDGLGCGTTLAFFANMNKELRGLLPLAQIHRQSMRLRDQLKTTPIPHGCGFKIARQSVRHTNAEQMYLIPDAGDDTEQKDLRSIIECGFSTPELRRKSISSFRVGKTEPHSMAGPSCWSEYMRFISLQHFRNLLSRLACSKRNNGSQE